MTELNIYEPTRQLRSSSDTSMLLLYKYFIIIIALNGVVVGAFFQHKLINLSHRRYRRNYNSCVDPGATVQPEMSRAPIQKLKHAVTNCGAATVTPRMDLMSEAYARKCPIL